jgi:hypothetical protein
MRLRARTPRRRADAREPICDELYALASLAGFPDSERIADRWRDW